MPVVLRLLARLPRSLLSRIVGRIARVRLPPFMLLPVVRAFAAVYGADLAEAARPPGGYRSFDDFFTRTLAPGVRPLDGRPDVIVSPCDGRRGAAGRIENGTALQIKGRPYAVADLVPPEWVHALAGGAYLTIYLAPGNYHRVHAPAAARVTAVAHTPGTLWPVNAAAVAHIDRLFCVNERLSFRLETAGGPMVAVMVGATCVGRITTPLDTTFVTNDGRTDPRERRYDDLRVAAGDELGVFHMGSTVVLLAAPGAATFAPGAVGDPVQMGRTVGVRPG